MFSFVFPIDHSSFEYVNDRYHLKKLIENQKIIEDIRIDCKFRIINGSSGYKRMTLKCKHCSATATWKLN